MKRNVVIGMAVALVAVLVAWYLVVYSPKSDQLDRTTADVATERKTAQDLQGQLRRLRAQAKNASQQQALLGRLNDAIPEQPDEADFILQANAIAEESGIEFLSIAPAPPVAGTGPSTIGLTITINGSFFQVKNYLTKLESLERLVIVDGINLSAGSSTDAAAFGDGITLSVTLNARMFTRAAPTVSADGTVPAPTGPDTSTPTDGSSTSSSTPAGSSTTGGT